MNLFLCALTLALVAQQTLTASPCVGKDSVNGTSVVITLSPSPLDALKAAGLENSKSPKAMMDLLQSFTDAAMGVINSMSKLTQTFPLSLLGLKIPKCRYYWMTNQLYCDDVNKKIIDGLCAGMNNIGSIGNPISFPMPQDPQVNLTCEDDTVRPWGLDMVRAPEAWAAGYKGKGIVVGNIDTGVRSTHVELKDNMRSTYNWLDPYNESTLTVPNDNFGHGTHSMGTMCGKTVGVAPEATWIACRGCGSDNKCKQEQLLACGQFMFCPDKGEQDCKTAPNVINNSWGGGYGDTFYDNVLALWKKAGIISFFSSGNSGPACFSVVSNADGNWTKMGFFSVGSSACNDHISQFSSVGPSQRADYMGALGVSIVGPGSNIKSAWFDGDENYKIKSGTSMSSPHAAGAAAVILSKNKNLTYEQMKDILFSTAVRSEEVTNATGGNAAFCGGPNGLGSGPVWPNNVYGYGRVDVAAAIEQTPL